MCSMPGDGIAEFMQPVGWRLLMLLADSQRGKTVSASELVAIIPWGVTGASWAIIPKVLHRAFPEILSRKCPAHVSQK